MDDPSWHISELFAFPYKEWLTTPPYTFAGIWSELAFDDGSSIETRSAHFGINVGTVGGSARFWFPNNLKASLSFAYVGGTPELTYSDIWLDSGANDQFLIPSGLSIRRIEAIPDAGSTAGIAGLALLGVLIAAKPIRASLLSRNRH